MEIKAKMNQWNLMKLKSLCRAKKTISKMKRKPTEWKKIFANSATYKGLVSKMYIVCVTRYQKKATSSKNEQKNQIVISPEKTYK